VPRRCVEAGVLAEMESAISTVPRPSLAEFGWNWRYELLLVTVLAGQFTSVGVIAGTGWLIAVTAADVILVAGAVAARPLRGKLIAAAWCVITSHRIRTGCRHGWVQSRDGRLPVVLHTTPTRYGERAVLWCRAGITADDLISSREIITVACWASEVRIVANQRGRHLVTLAVIRRPAAEIPQQTWPYLPRHEDLPQNQDTEEPATAA